MNGVFKEALPFLDLALLIFIVGGVIRFNKGLTALKFYTRRLCDSALPEKIKYGKDLE